MRAGDGPWERGVEITRDVPAAADRNEIGVLAEPAFGKMRPCECGATDEVDPIAESAAEEGQQVGDEVISLDLFYGSAELSGYRVDFVRIHDRPEPTARRGVA